MTTISAVISEITCLTKHRRTDENGRSLVLYFWGHKTSPDGLYYYTSLVYAREVKIVDAKTAGCRKNMFTSKSVVLKNKIVLFKDFPRKRQLTEI